jgi:hypothetical protein
MIVIVIVTMIYNVNFIKLLKNNNQINNSILMILEFIHHKN